MYKLISHSLYSCIKAFN